MVRNISKVLIPLKRVLKRAQDVLPFTGVSALPVRSSVPYIRRLKVPLTVFEIITIESTTLSTEHKQPG